MKSLADGLPPEIAAQLHPDWRANEVAYWVDRERLLAEYAGLWVAYAGGEVVASGPRPDVVFRAAHESGRHPFVIRAGAEDQPSRRRRRLSFGYDATYPGASLPQLTVEFRPAAGVPGVTLPRVIPDTGADVSALPWLDCRSLGLSPEQGFAESVSGVGGTADTLVFQVWVWLDGQEYPCELHADVTGRERLVGRDVLNQLEILFRGPAGEVVINP